MGATRGGLPMSVASVTMSGMDTDVIAWLLDQDPAVRWQVRRDLLDEPPEAVARERARVVEEGWGARILAAQPADGYWGGTVYGSNRERDSVMWSLQILRRLGAEPEAPRVREAIERVQRQVVWGEVDDLPYFHGEVEECVNGGVLAVASYFGVLGAGTDRILGLLLGQRRADGGWNCDPPEESSRSSFHPTLCVLEGLLAYEQAATGGDPADGDPADGGARGAAVAEARRSGEAYLLERALFRRKSTGEIVDERYLNFSFPTYWFYDVLRALDHLREARPESPDPRIAPAIDILLAQRGEDGRWPAGARWPGRRAYEIDAPPGEPSPWNTLRALRVLRWAGAEGSR
ncbi:hypothetical protein [Agromyces aerolatus]|uniref:hypothetical protein n=1 Tax=Agromyces sp. LY-1074 TaxID=3074080 RepID=UPI002860005E|nr:MULTISPECIES: hypothetical protein [unclassified Agromyces]MDR5699583.1 hypothetical protein [Agromyces sp. LY-1074]MDR5705879.1 hypothetical protein [Agromyces sp. LY-1358]